MTRIHNGHGSNGVAGAGETDADGHAGVADARRSGNGQAPAGPRGGSTHAARHAERLGSDFEFPDEVLVRPHRRADGSIGYRDDIGGHIARDPHRPARATFLSPQAAATQGAAAARTERRTYLEAQMDQLRSLPPAPSRDGRIRELRAQLRQMPTLAESMATRRDENHRAGGRAVVAATLHAAAGFVAPALENLVLSRYAGVLGGGMERGLEAGLQHVAHVEHALHTAHQIGLGVESLGVGVTAVDAGLREGLAAAVAEGVEGVAVVGISMGAGAIGGALGVGGALQMHATTHQLQEAQENLEYAQQRQLVENNLAHETQALESAQWDGHFAGTHIEPFQRGPAAEIDWDRARTDGDYRAAVQRGIQETLNDGNH